MINYCKEEVQRLRNALEGNEINYQTMTSNPGFVSSTTDLEKCGGSTVTLPEIQKPKVYKIRWLVLALFVCFSASNSMQWIQFSIISDEVEKYYGVSDTLVNWTSLIYMILYIPFIFPGSYLLEKLGLRKAIIIGIIGTCAGSWIKLGAVSPDRFYVAFIGQSLVALSQVFVLSVPARLAAVWFGPSQVSSACSIGVFGNQVGVATGFLIPNMIVTGGTTEQVSDQFYLLFGVVAVFTTALLILILMFFKNGPDTPPSYAAAQQEKGEEIDFMTSLKKLCINRSYMFLLLAYGINVGVFYAISTLLNQIVLHYYPDAAADSGRIGVVIVVAGMAGSVVCGVILDRYHKFKETTLVVYAFSLIGMIIFTFTLSKGIIAVYVVAGFLGFFMTGLLPVGFELGSELTYPEPEGTQAGLLNAASQVFGIAFTNVYSPIFKEFGDTWANMVMSVMLLIGLVLTACISSDLRRQAAIASSK